MRVILSKVLPLDGNERFTGYVLREIFHLYSIAVRETVDREFVCGECTPINAPSMAAIFSRCLASCSSDGTVLDSCSL